MALPAAAPRVARAVENASTDSRAETPAPSWRFVALMAILVLVGVAAGLAIAWAVGLAGGS